MEEVNTQTSTPNETTLVESPPVEETTPSVYAESPRSYDDPVRAYVGDLRSQAQEAAPPDAKAAEPPPGQRFGMNEDRKHQLAENLRAQREDQELMAELQAQVAPRPQPIKTATPIDPARASEIVGDYFTGAGDPFALLGRLYDRGDADRYHQLVEAVITAHPEYAARLLDWEAAEPSLDDRPDLAHLPPHLAEIAMFLEDRVWQEDLQYAPLETQIRFLEGEYELQEMRRAEREARWEAEEAEYQQQISDVETACVELVTGLSDIYEADHRKSLEDLKPYGANAQLNAEIHDDLLGRAMRSMAESPKWAKDQQEALALAISIPHFHALGATGKAQAAERMVRQLADEWNKEFARRLKIHRSAYDAYITDAESWRAYQASLPPEQRKPTRQQELAKLAREEQEAAWKAKGEADRERRRQDSLDRLKRGMTPFSVEPDELAEFRESNKRLDWSTPSRNRRVEKR